MKLVTFEVSSQFGRVRRLGALLDGDETGRVVDLNFAFANYLERETNEPTPAGLAQLRTPPDMLGWLRAGHEGFNAAERAIAYVRATADATGTAGEKLVHARGEVKLLAPVPEPPSFRDFFIYEQHMTRARRPVDGQTYKKAPLWYENPPYYKGSTSAIRGAQDPVPWPYYTKHLDLEIELGIVIGKAGRNLTVKEAQNHIAGYTILVDTSARDGQDREPFGPNKRKDFHTAIGPCLVTPDEIDAEHLPCRIDVDGELWFEGNTGDPHTFSPAQLVAYTSDNEDVAPGDLLGTGTIGFGCSMDIMKWVQIGQTMTFTIDGIGSMALKIVPGEHVVSHVLGMQAQIPRPALA